MSAAQQMDSQELTDLVRRHAGSIHRVAYAYCRNPADREEVVQEVALQLWRSRHAYDPRFPERTWVYRIALNVAISFQRRERRHRERRLALDEHAVTIAVASEAEPGEEVQLLVRCIDELSALDKALVLLYLEGNAHAAIADVLGISVSNVGTKLMRIKEKLRVAYERRARTDRTEEHHAAR
jgi:RNA polymerase sigma-70 factor (ECF subfamily)